MYNHTYQDAINGEGAPNHMEMPGGHYYPVLSDPLGWVQYQPSFLQDKPFYHTAGTEMHKTATVRGLKLEFGDQHQHRFAGGRAGVHPRHVAKCPGCPVVDPGQSGACVAATAGHERTW